MTTSTLYPWQRYERHLEALVWASPVYAGSNAALRHVLADALYMWSLVGLVDRSADPFTYQYRDGQATAYRSLFAYASGYTEGDRS